MANLISKRTDGNGERWKPTYQVFRKSSDGSRQVIASYFTLEEADARAKWLQEYSGEQYHVYDLLTQSSSSLLA